MPVGPRSPAHAGDSSAASPDHAGDSSAASPAPAGGAPCASPAAAGESRAIPAAADGGPHGAPRAPAGASVDVSWDARIAASGLPRHAARALAESVGGRTREWLVAHGDEPMPADQAARFDTLAARARAGEPLAYLLGWREFWGRRFEVGPGVLIPREDTECLVARTLSLLPVGARVADLGTGSGCIAITLAAERADLAVTATDRSPAALAIAARNAARLLGPQAGRLRLCEGDWYAALPAGERFEAIVSNPPYIAAGDRHLGEGDLRHEPSDALTDGADGLSALRALADGAADRLVPGGWLVVEHGFDQGAAVRALMTAAGLQGATTEADLSGNDRVSRAHVPGTD